MRFGRSFRLAILAVIACGAGGCRTTFEGEAKFPGGARGCYDKCQEIGMSMASFVFVGEYSTGCVCEPLRAPYPQPRPEARLGSKPPAEVGAAAAAAVGVVMQMSAAEEEARGHGTQTTPN